MRHGITVLWMVGLWAGACEHNVEYDADISATGDEAFEEQGALVASSECSAEAMFARAPNDERLWTLAVAQRWIELDVRYNRGGTFEGHRRDCSGFVSMAWGLPKPGPATAHFEPFADYPSSVEIPIDDLIAGDAINRRTRRSLPGGGTIGHIRLFGGWIDKAAGTHCIMEYYSTGKVGRAMKGTRADLDDYVGLRNVNLPTTPRDGDAAPAPAVDLPTANQPGCGVLGENQALARGEAKWSCDGRFQFVHQNDGNVVLYQNGVALWHAGTNGQSTSALVMQADGNLVLYRPNGSAVWHTQTHGHSTGALVVADDGNLIVLGPNWSVLWQSYTGGR
jgi:hypothetical protein